MYTDEMTAKCLGMTVEQYHKAMADKQQQRMATRAIAAAMAGDGKIAAKMCKERQARLDSFKQ